MFQPINKKKANRPTRYYESIIQSINEMILKGELKEGDQLPSERDLAEMFNTSRVPVREALKILEFLGIVEIIDGEGTFISSIEIPDLMNKIFFGVKIENENLSDIFDIRVVLEAYSAGRAAQYGTDEEVKKLRSYVEDMANAQPFSPELYKASVNFHKGVVLASKNAYLKNIYQFFSELAALSGKMSLQEATRPAAAVNYHKAIIDAIEAHDSQQAELLMREHLLEQKKYI